MATLKSIKNKYLQASDGDTLGVSDNSDNVALLAFKMQAADSIAKFNMVDGFSDSFVDATGIDTGGSTNEIRNAANYYSGSQDSLIETFSYWLPFVTINDINVQMSERTEGTLKNTMLISVDFILKKDPNTMESVQVTIGE